MFRSLLAVAAVVAVSVPIGASGNPVQPTLNAKVTARSISLTDSSGKPVQSLAQRSYRIVVKDSSKGQNFHLFGPSVNMKTKVASEHPGRGSLTFAPESTSTSPTRTRSFAERSPSNRTRLPRRENRFGPTPVEVKEGQCIECCSYPC